MVKEKPGPPADAVLARIALTGRQFPAYDADKNKKKE
jgi:hypothetical protein